MHLQLEILKEGYIYILRKALISYCNQLLWKTGAYDKDSPSWPNSCWGPGSAPSSRSVCAMCSIAQSCPTLATSWTVALQAPLSMGFSRQYWSGLSFHSLEDLTDPRDWTWVSWIVGRFFTIWATREYQFNYKNSPNLVFWKKFICCLVF